MNKEDEILFRFMSHLTGWSDHQNCLLHRTVSSFWGRNIITNLSSAVATSGQQVESVCVHESIHFCCSQKGAENNGLLLRFVKFLWTSLSYLMAQKHGQRWLLFSLPKFVCLFFSIHFSSLACQSVVRVCRSPCFASFPHPLFVKLVLKILHFCFFV